MGDEKGVVVADGDGVEATPLLPKGVGGTTSSTQTFGNIIVSIVGTGVLGLPFAFRVAGWLVGSLAVIFAGISTFYCMLLLIECRERVEEEEAEESTQIQTYGDLGGRAFGAAGRFATEFVVLISQCGGAVAYLVFIGQNLSSIFKSHNLPFSTFIFLLVPVEIALSLI
ncbi:ADP/ATP carrier protein [Asimina triloba]